MIFSGYILELSQQQRTCLLFNKITTQEGSRIRQIIGNHFSTIYTQKGMTDFVPLQTGIWSIVDEPDNNKNGKTSNFVTLKESGLEYEDFEDVLDTVYSCIDQICIGVAWLSLEDRHIFTKNLQTREYFKRKGLYSSPTTDGKRVYARYNMRDLVCLDFELQEVWRSEIKIEAYSTEIREAQFFDQLVILNVGVDKETRQNFEISAFKKHNGERAWETVLEKEPDSSTVIGSKVYITMHSQMMVLSAQTGSILINEPHGFSVNSDHSVYPFDNTLVAFSEPDSKIRIFTNDGKTLLQEFKVPSPYSPLAKEQPIYLEGKLYQPLTSNNMTLAPACGGLLILSVTAKGETPEIKVEERPPHSIITTENEKGEHELVITMSHDNLDDILRFGEIILKQTAYLKGYHMFPAETRDTKYNGKIHFSVDITKISTESHAQIEEMVQEVEDYLKEMDVYSGSGENSVNIDIKFE